MLLIDGLRVSDLEACVLDEDPKRWVSAKVRGVDLYPPPDNWVPPNCILKVDDVLKVINTLPT